MQFPANPGWGLLLGLLGVALRQSWGAAPTRSSSRIGEGPPQVRKQQAPAKIGGELHPQGPRPGSAKDHPQEGKQQAPARIANAPCPYRQHAIENIDSHCSLHLGTQHDTTANKIARCQMHFPNVLLQYTLLPTRLPDARCTFRTCCCSTLYFT